MSKTVYSAIMVVIIAVVTLLTRALPFLIFPENKKAPKVITYLSTVLPCSIMGMLVVYCLKGINFTVAPFGASEIIACLIVVVTYVWKRNTLISIISGTVSYMVLIQLIFN